MPWTYRITDQNPQMTLSEMEGNADAFAAYFSGYMTDAAMAGILGSMQHESFLNPGQTQLNKGGSLQYGYGLIQWDDGSILISWCQARGLTWYDGDSQLYRIKCEGERINGCSGYFYPGNLNGIRYSYTWSQFCQLTDWAEACKAYVAERERAGVTALSTRLGYAEDWYKYLHNGIQPPAPSPTPPPYVPPGKDMPFWYGGVRDLMRRGVISNGKL